MAQQPEEVKITIVDQPDNDEVGVGNSYFLGREDKETEQRFGAIDFSQKAIDNMNRLSIGHIQNEVGGFMVGWTENGVKHVADTLVYIPENPQVGQFRIMDGEQEMLWAMERMKENPDYEGHELEVLGWWHTHPPILPAYDGTEMSPMPPFPTGGMQKDQLATGDLGVNEYYSRKFGNPQEMLIIETSKVDLPIRFALWRWNDAENAESAHFQSGIKVTKDDERGNIGGISNPGYWELPDGGQKQHNLRIHPEDIVEIKLDDDQPRENWIEIDLSEPIEVVPTAEELDLEFAEELALVDEQAEVEIEVIGEENTIFELDLRELYKPEIADQLSKIIDMAKASLQKNIRRITGLKNQLNRFLAGPYDSIPEIRIQIEDALQQIEVLESDVEVADQITILGEEESDDVLDQIKILRTRRRRKIQPPPLQ